MPIDCNLSLGPLVVNSTSITCGNVSYPSPSPIHVFGNFSTDSSTAIQILSTSADLDLSSVTITCSTPIYIEHSDVTLHFTSTNFLSATGVSSPAISCSSNSNVSILSSHFASLIAQVGPLTVGIGASLGSECANLRILNGSYSVSAGSFSTGIGSGPAILDWDSILANLTIRDSNLSVHAPLGSRIGAGVADIGTSKVNFLEIANSLMNGTAPEASTGIGAGDAMTSTSFSSVSEIVIDGGNYTISTVNGFPPIGSLNLDQSDADTFDSIVIRGGNFSLSADGTASGIVTASTYGSIAFANATVDLDCWTNRSCIRATLIEMANSSLKAVTFAPNLFRFVESFFGENVSLSVGYRRFSRLEQVSIPCLHFGEIDSANFTVFDFAFRNASSVVKRVPYDSSELTSLMVSLPANETYRVEASADGELWDLCDSVYSSPYFAVGNSEAFYAFVEMCEQTNRTMVATVTPPVSQTSAPMTLTRSSFPVTQTPRMTKSQSPIQTISKSPSPTASSSLPWTRSVSDSPTPSVSATFAVTPVETRTPSPTTMTSSQLETAWIIGVAVGGGVLAVVVLAIVTKVVFLPRCRREKGHLIIIPPDEVEKGPYMTQWIDPD